MNENVENETSKTSNQGKEVRAGRGTLFVSGHWLRDMVLVALAFAIGWWAHTNRAVQAQSPDLFFQLQGLSPGTALALYYPDQKTIFVYQNALAGFPNLNCTYAFKLGEPGAMVERQQCKSPSFQP